MEWNRFVSPPCLSPLSLSLSFGAVSQVALVAACSSQDRNPLRDMTYDRSIQGRYDAAFMN